MNKSTVACDRRFCNAFFAKYVPVILSVGHHTLSRVRGFQWLVASYNSFCVAEDLHGFMC